MILRLYKKNHNIRYIINCGLRKCTHVYLINYIIMCILNCGINQDRITGDYATQLALAIAWITSITTECTFSV